MILMKCPQCGKSAEAPEQFVDEGLKCYQCQVPLEIADSRVADGLKQQKLSQWLGLLIGAVVGGGGVLSAGLFGGEVGQAFAGAVAGAFLGIVVGFIEGLFSGLSWSVVMWDSGWLRYWAKFTMFVGGVVGLVLGATGELDEFYGTLAVPLGGAIGGLSFGGLIGMHLGRARVSPEEVTVTSDQTVASSEA